MSAEITEIKVTKYTAECKECEVWLGSVMARPAQGYLRDLVDKHDKYCHSDELIPHYITTSRPELIGWGVECVCGKMAKVIDYREMSKWVCPLDKTVMIKKENT